MGPQGNPGLSGATIRDWKIDRARCVAIPVMSDGSEGPRLELRYSRCSRGSSGRRSIQTGAALGSAGVSQQAFEHEMGV